MKKFLSIFALPLAVVTLASCGSGTDWNKPAALEIGARPLILPTASNLNAYISLSDFSSSTAEPKPKVPLGGKSSGLDIQPASCVTSNQYVTVGGAYLDENSISAKSFGGGWSIVFSDFNKGKTFAATIFSDEGKSNQPLIQDLYQELESCSKVTHLLTDVKYQHEFKVTKISENTLEINFTGTASDGLSNVGLVIVNQVGRNLISTGMYHYKWDSGSAPSITQQEKSDLYSALLVMGQNILVESKK
jgi:DNA-dependent RNA polymerase auxiliary subunit epsilon